MNHLSGDNSRG